jgi:putative PIN family toxin of toxin-antitoxin system
VSWRAVYDTMVFFQWAALPASRQHATIRALYDGSILLCLSQELVDEVLEVLSRPEVRAKAPNLTDERVREVLTAALAHAEWVANVSKEFTWAAHPDDDHLFNLAVAAKADFLVTWEKRIHKLASDVTPEAHRLKALAPQLEVVTPMEPARRLGNRPPQP